MKVSKEAVLSALSSVAEPDLKKNIVELGLVDQIKVEDGKVSFQVAVANPAMHARKRMEEACAFAIERALGKEWETSINVVPIPEDKRNADTRKVLPGVKNIIAVASGKGGVGKSTMSSNLAVGLAQKGYKVGLIDADIYGPSAPTMFDLTLEKPRTVESGGKNYIEPLEQYGVKVLSIGFFADMDQAIVWRGPMASKALTQLFTDALWGPLDYMIIDLPPGTGDIHLSLVQVAPISGAVIVTTPQEVALADARKAVGMFKLDSIKVPVLGIVENMSWFTPEELPDSKYYIFGKDGGANLAERLEVPFLGAIPLVQSVREAGDVGNPAVRQKGTPIAEHFEGFITNFVKQVEKRNAELPATKTVNITTQ